MKALLALLVLTAVGASPGTAAAESDPWTRVPELASGCYRSDDFVERIAAAKAAVTRELADQLRNIDPMELASRQQQFMMAHPEEAMAALQRGYDLGQSSSAVDNTEKALAFQRELQELDTRYETALASRLRPIRKKFEDLDARAQKDLVVSGESWVYAPWAVQEYNALAGEENAAYEALCAEWWAPGGGYRGWLGRYRDHLLADRIPADEETEAVGAGYMVMLVGTPEASYKSTATLSAVADYLGFVGQVYAKRRQAPVGPLE